jgi:hypothetical protein
MKTPLFLAPVLTAITAVAQLATPTSAQRVTYSITELAVFDFPTTAVDLNDLG